MTETTLQNDIEKLAQELAAKIHELNTTDVELGFETQNAAITSYTAGILVRGIPTEGNPIPTLAEWMTMYGIMLCTKSPSLAGRMIELFATDDHDTFKLLDKFLVPVMLRVDEIERG